MLAAAVVCLGAFLRSFDFHVPQYTDLLWPTAILCWILFVRSIAPAEGRVLPGAGDYLPMAVLLPMFVACWLPFYDNWRWAFTGDSFGIFTSGYWFGRNGPGDSLLSVHGIDNFYTRIWETAYNWLMYVVAPTLFWHRLGQLLMACLALLAIYSFFCLTLGRWWAALIVIGTATNYVWLWISYISYLRTDSFVFYYSTLIVGLALWRAPRRRRLWMAGGLIGGLSLFFTPVVWGAVGAVAIVLGLRDLWRRRLDGIAIYTVSFVVAAVPMLIELPWMLEMLGEQSLARDASNSVFLPDLSYLWRTYRTILFAGYYTPIDVLGVDYGFLRPPLQISYLVGLAVAAVGILPPLRRRLRIPTVAPVLLGLMMWDAVLFTATNKGYGAPSHKRFYNLIPMEVFFALLPAIVVEVWVSRRPVLGRGVRMIAVAALALAAAAGIQTIQYPRAGTYGSNFYDGLIELRQRYPEREVLLVSNRIGMSEMIAPDNLVVETYGLSEHLRRVEQLAGSDLSDTCRASNILCFDMRGQFELSMAEMERDGHWRPFPLLNSTEIKCYECGSAAPG